MATWWDEIVAANDEVLNALVDSLNISSWFEDSGAAAAKAAGAGGAGGAGGVAAGAPERGLVQAFVVDAVRQASAFAQAVNWAEPFFIGLMFVHLIVLAGTVEAIRRGATELTFVAWLLVLVALVVCSSTLNSAGPAWVPTLFPKTRTNYFDGHGLFVSVVWAAPLVLQALLMMFVLVVSTAKLFAVVKIKKARAEMRDKIKKDA